MRKTFSAFAALFFILLAAAQTEVKVMSYNIRFDVQSDGENWWEKRKDKLARTESAKLILYKMKELTSGKQYPVVFMGDLNSNDLKYPSDHFPVMTYIQY